MTFGDARATLVLNKARLGNVTLWLSPLLYVTDGGQQQQQQQQRPYLLARNRAITITCSVIEIIDDFIQAMVLSCNWKQKMASFISVCFK